MKHKNRCECQILLDRNPTWYAILSITYISDHPAFKLLSCCLTFQITSNDCIQCIFHTAVWSVRVCFFILSGSPQYRKFKINIFFRCRKNIHILSLCHQLVLEIWQRWQKINWTNLLKYLVTKIQTDLFYLIYFLKHFSRGFLAHHI